MTDYRIEKPSFNRRTIRTEIHIGASPDAVWQTLVDIRSSSRWSQSIIFFDGDIRDNGKITVKIKLFASVPFLKKYHHQIKVSAGRYFCWNDTRILGAHDNHMFAVERTNERATKFIHSDELVGGFTWMIGDIKMHLLKRLYSRFNNELKEETERRARQAKPNLEPASN